MIEFNPPFPRAWRKLHGIEGDFSNDPKDSGGATRFGITEAVARAHGYTGPMNELPFERAMEIGKVQYWDALLLDEVAVWSYNVAYEVFECAFNGGLGTAATMLQESLNVLNRSDTGKPLWPDLVVDGHIGMMTVSALESYLGRRGVDGERVLLKMLNCLQGARYIRLATSRQKDEKWVYGWFKQRIEIPD